MVTKLVKEEGNFKGLMTAGHSSHYLVDVEQGFVKILVHGSCGVKFFLKSMTKLYNGV